MRRALVPLTLVLLCLAVPAAAQGGRPYRARLSPVPLDVAMQSTIAGPGAVTATLAGTTLTLTGTFAGLKTPSTVVRVHRGPRTAMRGPAIGDRNVTSGTSGTMSGTLELTKERVDDLANGRLYIQLHSEKALDAATGDLIWENQVGPNAVAGFGSMRNIAIYGDKIFLATTDARLVALDARNGKVVWDIAVADWTKGFSNSSGPIVVRGKVIEGLQGCDRYGDERCYISAYDSQTGKLLWKFHTVARSGEPGGDTWGELPDTMRAGGGSPRVVPRTITPEINPPSNGHTLYVFELPRKLG